MLSPRRFYISTHVVFDENTLPYLSPKEYQTNIDVSPYLGTFVESFSEFQAHDNSNSGEVQVSTTHINIDNAATSDIHLDDKGIINLLGT